jgi:hypothetical protein
MPPFPAKILKPNQDAPNARYVAPSAAGESIYAKKRQQLVLLAIL